MARTYCGKSCDECSYKEELSCPGCLAGPGKPFYAECDLAQCCQIKCHESCETCSIQPHCGKLRGKERIPEQRIRNRQAEAEHLASVRSRTPVLAKWLWLLLWLLVPQIIGELMTEDFVVEAIPALRVPGLALQAVCLVAECFILLKLSALEERYKYAAICRFAGLGLTLLAQFLTGGEAATWTLLLTVPASILSMIAVYNTYHAHAAAIGDFEVELAYKWEMLWKWEIGALLVSLGAILLTVIAPLLGLLALLAGAIASLVISIVSMIYLYRTAYICRQMAAMEHYNAEMSQE